MDIDKAVKSTMDSIKGLEKGKRKNEIIRIYKILAYSGNKKAIDFLKERNIWLNPVGEEDIECFLTAVLKSNNYPANFRLKAATLLGEKMGFFKSDDEDKTLKNSLQQVKTLADMINKPQPNRKQEDFEDE